MDELKAYTTEMEKQLHDPYVYRPVAPPVDHIILGTTVYTRIILESASDSIKEIWENSYIV